MKVTKLALLVPALTVSLMANAATDSVNVNISGTVVANSCTITEKAAGASVSFGRVSVGDFSTTPGFAAATKDFSIHLTDCGADTSSVTISASGTPDLTLPEAFINEATTGAATNVGVTIFGGADRTTQLKPSGDNNVTYDLDAKNENELPFTAKLVQDSAKTPGTGELTSVVTLKLLYN
ncbi:fimbrial protein [Enterobacter hormaechei]